MKKFVSYFLLVQTISLILLNNCLYFYNFKVEQKEKNWINAMQLIPDQEFSVLKLNASLYSFANDLPLEYVNSNVVIGKNTYHIFKRKIKDNILYLYYLKNVNFINKQLKQLITEDNLGDTKNGAKKILKVGINDYLLISAVDLQFFKFSQTAAPSLFVKSNLVKGFLSLSDQPPKYS